MFSKKLIFTYSIIMIVVLFILTFFVTQVVTDVLLAKEFKSEKQLVGDFSQYIDNTILSAKKVIQDIYLSDDDLKSSFFDWLSYEGDKLDYDYLNKNKRFINLFSNILNNNPAILDVLIMNGNNNFYSYSRYERKVIGDYDFLKYPWYKDIIKGNKEVRIIPSYIPKYMNDDSRLVYSLVASIYDNRYKTVGTMIFNLDVGLLQKYYQNYNKDAMGQVFIFDNKGNVVFDSSGKNYERKYGGFNELLEKQGYNKYGNGSLVSVDNSSKNGFCTVSICSNNKLFGNVKSVTQTIYLIFIVCIIISLILVYLSSSLVTKRIHEIIKAIKEVKKGNLKARINFHRGNDELEQISHQFNEMCEKLEEYIGKVYYSELKQKDAELAALQAQINPHFLYNTIEAIRMKSILSGNKEVGKMLYSLGSLFRMAVKGDSMYVTLREELAYCKSYLDLHKIRYEDRLKVELCIPEELMKYKIAKLLVQPIIENAIVHGVESTSVDITISISAYKEDETIFIKVGNDGITIDDERLTDIQNYLNENVIFNGKKSIGLKNVNERIKIIYGNKYGVSINSSKDSGVSVRISIPASVGEEAN